MKYLILPLLAYLLTISLHAEDKKIPQGIQVKSSVSITIKNTPVSEQSTINGLYVINLVSDKFADLPLSGKTHGFRPFSVDS